MHKELRGEKRAMRKSKLKAEEKEKVRGERREMETETDQDRGNRENVLDSEALGRNKLPLLSCKWV